MTWRDAFQPVEPGQEPKAAPLSLRTWTSQTLYGLLGGMLFGGYRGLQQSRDSKIPSPTPTTSAHHRMAVFFVRESILTGARVGIFVSIFSAAALVAEAALGPSRPANYAAAGAVTCGLFGGATAGWVAVPTAAGFGAVTAGAAGFAHAALEDVADRAGVQEVVDVPVDVVEESPVSRVIRSLEESMENRPKQIDKDSESNMDRNDPST